MKNTDIRNASGSIVWLKNPLTTSRGLENPNMRRDRRIARYAVLNHIRNRGYA